MITYSCGCQKGVRLCADAVRLWDLVALAYNLAKAGQVLWAAYDEARSRYDDHFLAIDVPTETVYNGFTERKEPHNV